MNRKKEFSAEEKKFILDSYLKENGRIYKIAKQLGVGSRRVRRLLVENNIEIKNNGHFIQNSLDDYSVNENGCWIWNNGKTKDRYGVITIGGKKCYTHRLSYERRYGRIPNGLDIDHLCRDRSCMNPEHLEAVTRKENLARGEHKNKYGVNREAITANKGI